MLRNHGRQWFGGLLLAGLLSGVAALAALLWATPPTTVRSAPLAQATATATATLTPTPTATPTLPPLRDYSPRWSVQSLPGATINCVIDREAVLGGGTVACVSGTPVP